MNAPPGHLPPIPIDEATIDLFVTMLFAHLDGYVPVRGLSETGTPSQKPVSLFPLTGDLARTLKAQARWAAETSRGLYVVPGTVPTTGSAKATDVKATSILVIDIDRGDIAAARDLLARHLGLPTMEVASGGVTAGGQGKLHLYWQLTEPATGPELERVRALRERIAVAAGGDLSFKSLHQPVRVPGSIHGKDGRRTPVRLLEHRAVKYELDDLEERAASMSALEPDKAFGFEFADGAARVPTATRATRPVRAGGADAETRFDALSGVIGHWIRSERLGHCTLDEAWAAVADYNVAMVSPPWDEDRLRREFEALLDRDRRSHPRAPAVEDQEGSRREVALSDDALAAAFARRYGAEWRYVAVWGAWYGWTGTRWARDETGQVREWVRQVCRTEALTAEKPHEQRRIASDKTIAAVLRIASCDPTLATRPTACDADPMLLNTPKGVIDLDTGELLEHLPDRLQTQITAASPGSACPRWLAFLDEITGGDCELVSYLQRLSGYILTGSTKEQVFAFFHGPGANGKSVFIQTIAAIMGDYAATATLETFMASPATRHLTELAGLRAARLVIVPETEAGRAWSEARIKTVTGGEKVRANFMHRDHFEYTPQFKLLVAGNHRPSLGHVGEAMRRRLHLVPFDVTIPPDARDLDLSAKLLAERDGILGWMLTGCADWQRIGLAPPKVVTEAATAYFADEDNIGQWIEECCDAGLTRQATSNALFRSWSGWAEVAGQPKETMKALGEALRQRGFKATKVGRARGWQGLAPRPAPMREALEP